ncbi:NAD(P)/FAD-dependent oxidoreductase [Paenibacillus vini]|uniref:NAD(P)/FAD-dependent oxidoreductase n=1 Tax=Paenibacillus vini TaxID=1476024 RepID=UPI0025B7135F|nr:NAD(P)/FAD-dependent oxidoreductase [Paenibacillus vini]MDN4070508.1 NAD(P)/FAD-dependent oxidoreductase [Paenibacillus vini]
MLYDCIIVGGGIAGLQAAIQLGRYDCHQVLVIDSGDGRSAICRNYRNILGFPDGISGPELRSRGQMQAESLGVSFQHDRILQAEQTDGKFKLTGADGTEYRAVTLLLATGVMDRFPDIPGLLSVLGSTVYICPDCDGHEIQNRRTVLMGSGNAGADMAMILADRTKELVYLNHESETVSPDRRERLKSLNIGYEEGQIAEVIIGSEGSEGDIKAVVMTNGRSFEAERGFIAFGGNQVHSELAGQLGIALSHNKHIETDPRSKETNIAGVFAAGDLGVHAEQVTVAMGEGSIAAIWIHKALST